MSLVPATHSTAVPATASTTAPVIGHTLSAADVSAFIYNGLPTAEASGFVVESVSPQQVLCRMRYSPDHLRPGGTIAGPVMMELADAAMYAAIIANMGPIAMAVTQNFNINFMNRPGQCDLLAYAEILKLGKRIVFLEVKLYSDNADRPFVAHVTGSYALPPAHKMFTI